MAQKVGRVLQMNSSMPSQVRDFENASRAELNPSGEAALAALEGSTLYRQAFGDRYIDYFLSLKRAELARCDRAMAEAGRDWDPDVVDPWEQDEYLDFF